MVVHKQTFAGKRKHWSHKEPAGVFHLKTETVAGLDDGEIEGTRNLDALIADEGRPRMPPTSFFSSWATADTPIVVTTNKTPIQRRLPNIFSPAKRFNRILRLVNQASMTPTFLSPIGSIFLGRLIATERSWVS